MNRLHGLTGTPEHRSWVRMITRCYWSKPSYPDWPLYQGAGIRVCDRWRESYLNFLADMGPKPTPKHTIDRIDSHGNYEPSNCRWATPAEQTRNTIRNRLICHNGLTLPLADWASRTGLRRETIADRLDAGWSIEKALTTALMGKGGKASQRRTHCRLGHEMTPENTYVRNAHEHQCKTCRSLRGKQDRLKRKSTER